MKVVKGYKAFDKDFSCRGFKYKVGKTYELNEEPKICETGFHFCKKIKDVLEYYPITSRFAEIEALGSLDNDKNKTCTNKIKIIKELTRDELLVLFKCKDSNLGKDNLGNRNTGNRNTGNRNTGNWNTGNSNTGDWNTGNRNTGNRNTGNRNTGDWNTGNRNTGNSNTGNSNTGYSNTGYSNTGYSNTGYSNTGDSNTGDRNTGDWNTGNRNTGNWNTGYSNTGNWNTGNWNKANLQTGYFNTIEPNTIDIFNKPCSKKDWENADKPSFIFNVLPNVWVDWNDMNNQEKIDNKYAYIQEGYLKSITMEEAWANAFKKATPNDIELLKELPNFDAKVFKEITGIEIK